MAIVLVADTQVLVWYVREPSRLTKTAVEALEIATANGDIIGVSAFSIVELVYATEKATSPISLDDLNAIKTVLGDPPSPFQVIEIDEEIAFRVGLVPRISNADPGDRIIVATAEVLGLPLVSSDSKIPDMTSLTIIW
jgi:PIN domain nuclease of toxin-antitoxin system